MNESVTNGTQSLLCPGLFRIWARKVAGLGLNRLAQPSTPKAGDPGERTDSGSDTSQVASPSGNPGRRVLEWMLIAAFLAGLSFLAWFSFHLASIRIFQVDECANVFVAKYLALGEAAKLGGSIDLFQCILSLFEHGVTRSIDLFVNARFFMLEVFWLNIVLLAMATGERILSLRGLIALTVAATLAPVWDFGFEARHDNLVLTSVLLTWCGIRSSKPGPQTYTIAGAMLVFSQFVASKSFVYTVPIAALALVFPPPGVTARRWQIMLAWLAGAASAGLVLWFIYRSSGLWGGYMEGGRKMAALAGKSTRLAPWIALKRLPVQTPLLLAVCFAGLAGSAGAIFRRDWKSLFWNSALPEACLALVALTALFVNPTPYPYNLLHLVPYAFLFAWRWSANQVTSVCFTPQLTAACISLFVFTHLVPFGLATVRHLGRLNFRQEKLMTLAEEMTGPADPVYDASGLIPTRPMVHRLAFLHGVSVQMFLDETEVRWRDLLASNPPAVFLPSYRTDWLNDADHSYITNRYVPLADDFWTLGKVLPPGGGTFEIIHAGRYRISTLKGSDLDGTYPLGLKGLTAPEDPGSLTCKVDGQDVSAGTVNLAVGTHSLECVPGIEPAVVWVGPHLDRVHRLGPGDHLALFVNWY